MAIIFIIVLFVLLFSTDDIDKKTNNNSKISEQYLPSEINKNIPAEEKINHEIYDATFEENQKNVTEQSIEQKFEIDKDLYPVLDLLNFNIDDASEKIKNYQFKGNDYDIHVSWINKIKNQLGDKLDEKTLAEITKNHIAFFYLSDELDKNYLEKSDINFEEYKEAAISLFIWDQKILQEKMTDEDYQKFFGNQKNEAEDAIRSVVNLTPEFQYYNSDVAIEEIYEKIPRWKLDRIVEFSKICDLDLLNLNDDVNTGKIAPEEAVDFAESSNKAYFESAKEILDEEEFHLMFASVENQF